MANQDRTGVKEDSDFSACEDDGSVAQDANQNAKTEKQTTRDEPGIDRSNHPKGKLTYYFGRRLRRMASSFTHFPDSGSLMGSILFTRMDSKKYKMKRVMDYLSLVIPG